jgi:hypothetical protein
MQRHAFVFAAALVTSVQWVQAEPVFMPQASSAMSSKQWEVGTGAEIGYQRYDIEGSAGTDYSDRVWNFPLRARLGVTDTVESRLEIPLTYAVSKSEGATSTRYDDFGLGNIQLGAKWNFLKKVWPLAAMVNFDLPTANPAHHPASLGRRYNGQLQQGFNTHVGLVADSPLFAELVRLHGSVGYLHTGRYRTTSNVRFNPSNLATFGASVEMVLEKWVPHLSMAGELVGSTALNHSETDSVKNGADKGTVLEAGPSLRYQMGSVGLHAGLLFDAGPATFRAYNMRGDFGMSLQFGKK